MENSLSTNQAFNKGAPNIKAKHTFKLKVFLQKLNSTNHIIEHLKISNDSFYTEVNQNIRPHEIDDQKEDLNRLKALHLKVLNLHAEFKLHEDHEFEEEAYRRHSQVFAQELRGFLIRVDEILKLFDVIHLKLKIPNIPYLQSYCGCGGLYTHSFYDMNNLNIIQTFQWHKQISIIWNYTTYNTRNFIEWMSSPNWAKDQATKHMVFKNSYFVSNFMETYIEFFLKTENPSSMFKSVFIQTDPNKLAETPPDRKTAACSCDYFLPTYDSIDIPRYFLKRNFFDNQKYPAKEDVNEMLLEKYNLLDDEIAKELVDIKRGDGYTLRIIMETTSFYDAKSLTFMIHNMDDPPKNFLSELASFSDGVRLTRFDLDRIQSTRIRACGNGWKLTGILMIKKRKFNKS